VLLFREDLLEEIRAGRLISAGLDLVNDEARVQSGSIDLRIGDSAARYLSTQGMVSAMRPRRLGDIDRNAFQRVAVSEGIDFTINPGEFMLVEADLYLSVPLDMAVYVEGKSSIGRAGLFVVNAGFVEPGFQGTITLELFNAAPFPILLVGGEDIAQLVVMRGSRATQYPYGSPGLNNRYQGQVGVTPPRRAKGAWGAPV
jgi:dCTP deaminase